MEDFPEKKQHNKEILMTLLPDRLCSDDNRINMKTSKDAMVSMIIDSLRPSLDRLVDGALVYPEKYHRINLSTDVHHLLQQVFLRCPSLSVRDPQLKRVFFEEVKDGEGPHGHFIMETPRGMTILQFTDLLEKRWRGIATRNQRFNKQMQRLKRPPKLCPL